MAPRLETVRLAQMRNPAPDEDEGVLQGVFGQSCVAQDPVGDREERVADLAHEDGERFAVAATRLLDEVSIHVDLSVASGQEDWITHYDGPAADERSRIASDPPEIPWATPRRIR